MTALWWAVCVFALCGVTLVRSRDGVVAWYGRLLMASAVMLALVASLVGCASSGKTKAAQVAVVGAAVVDLHSTRQALGQGAVEANPIMGQAMGQQVFVKAAATWAILWATREVEKRSPVVARLVLGAVAVAWMVASAHNYQLGGAK